LARVLAPPRNGYTVYIAGPVVGAALGAFAYQLVRGEHPESGR